MGWLIWKKAAVQDLLFMHSLLLAQCLCAKNSPAPFVPGDLFSQMGTSLLPGRPGDLSHFCKSSCNMQGSTHFFQKHVMSQQSPLSPAGDLCLGAREGHGLLEEPCMPGGPWVRGWGHAVLSG